MRTSLTSCHVLPEVNLRIISPVVYFANTNLTGEKVQVLPSEKELRKLLDNSPNSFKKSNIHSWNPLLVTKGGIEFL